MEKSKKLNSFCNKCQSNAVTNEKIKKAFDYICYLDNLIDGGGESGVTNAEYDDNTGILKITFFDGSEREVVIPSANGLIPSTDSSGNISWHLKEAGTENRLPRGNGALDFSYEDSVGSPKSQGDVHFGFQNDSEADFGYNFIAGVENSITNAFFNGMVLGYQNTIVGGYGSVAIGYKNDLNTNRAIAGSMTLGIFNVLREYNVFAIGGGLISKTKGTVVVGEGNTDYPTTGAQDPNRPMFVVGIGYISVNGGSFGTVTERKDGLVVRKSGEVEAPEQTILQYDQDTTGKILVTKEILEDKVTSNGIKSIIGFSFFADNTLNPPSLFNLRNSSPYTLVAIKNQLGLYTFKVNGATLQNTSIVQVSPRFGGTQTLQKFIPEINVVNTDFNTNTEFNVALFNPTTGVMEDPTVNQRQYNVQIILM
jgi:hypothetical protein